MIILTFNWLEFWFRWSGILNSKCFFLLPCSFDRISRSWCFTEKHCSVPWPASFQEGWRPDHGSMLLAGLGWVIESRTNHVKQLWDSGRIWTVPPLVVRHFKELPCMIVVYHVYCLLCILHSINFFFFFFFLQFLICWQHPQIQVQIINQISAIS